MVDLDVLVIGGGLQGLAVLNELTRHGYAAALVTNADLGAGQTLHSHGLLNSGYLFPAEELRRSVSRDWIPFAEARGVALYGEDQCYIVSPPDPYQQLRQGWEANGYEYEVASTAALPAGFVCDPRLLVVKAREYSYPKRQLVRAVSAGLLDRILRGDILAIACTTAPPAGWTATAASIQVQTVTVRLHASGEQIMLAPRALICAAGTGTHQLIRSLSAEPSFAASAAQLGATAEQSRLLIERQLESISYRRSHMLCLRAPRDLLPAATLILLSSHALLIAGHLNHDHDGVSHSDSDYVTWYVTPMEPTPLRQRQAPDNASVEVAPEVVARGFTTLLEVFPALREEAARQSSAIRFAAYAGYKQDFNEHPAMPMCEPVAGMGNVIVALPSLATNVWINARKALALLQQRFAGRGGQVAIPGGGRGVEVGVVNELMPEVAWMSWQNLVERYPAIAHR